MYSVTKKSFFQKVTNARDTQVMEIIFKNFRFYRKYIQSSKCNFQKVTNARDTQVMEIFLKISDSIENIFSHRNVIFKKLLMPEILK